MKLCLKFRLLLVVAAMLAACLPPQVGAQAGGGGAAGAGAGAGSAGPGAGAAAAGHGAAATPTAPAANGQAAGVSQAATYAASTAPGLDPRRPPHSRPGAYTLAQLLDMARTRNPNLLAAEQSLQAVHAQELQAGLRVNPFLTVYGTDVTEGVDAASPYNYSVQIARLFERGQKRRWRLDAARATTAQSRDQLEDTIRQTELTLRQAFTHMLIAKEVVELSAASLKDFQHEVEIGNDRYKAGDLGKLDFERLDLQLGSLESDEANGRIALTQASDQLQTLVGIAIPTAEFDISGMIVPPLLTQTIDGLLQSAMANRPDYAAARDAVAAAEANARLAIANGTTDPTLEAEFDRNGAENSAGFSVNIPLRFFDRNQGNRATTKYQAAASQFTATAARNQVVSDVDQAWDTYLQAKKLSDRFGEHYLDESQDVLSIAQFAFEHGGLALIDYLDALRGARASTSVALNAYQQTWLALHQLSSASAMDLTP